MLVFSMPDISSVPMFNRYYTYIIIGKSNAILTEVKIPEKFVGISYEYTRLFKLPPFSQKNNLSLR